MFYPLIPNQKFHLQNLHSGQSLLTLLRSKLLLESKEMFWYNHCYPRNKTILLLLFIGFISPCKIHAQQEERTKSQAHL